jgi:hypothetical protein
MNNLQNDITLEHIAQQKAALRKRIGSQKQKMTHLSQEFLKPLSPTTKNNSTALGLFNKGMVVFDGVLIGYKVLKRFRKFFYLTRKKIIPNEGIKNDPHPQRQQEPFSILTKYIIDKNTLPTDLEFTRSKKAV